MIELPSIEFPEGWVSTHMEIFPTVPLPCTAGAAIGARVKPPWVKPLWLTFVRLAGIRLKAVCRLRHDRSKRFARWAPLNASAALSVLLNWETGCCARACWLTGLRHSISRRIDDRNRFA